MKAFALTVLAVVVPGACRVGARTPDGRPPVSDAVGATAVLDPSERPGGRFYSRTNAAGEGALTLREFSAHVTTRPGTVRTRLTISVATADDGQSEAVMRLAIPRGAAVTKAMLWVNGRRQNGAFVERERARQIYRSIVDRRHDPALVTWDGPGWVAVSIFPLERGEPRRFELEWVEPAAVADGHVQYRVPILAEGSRLVGRAMLSVDGRVVSSAAQTVLPIAPTRVGAGTIVAARAPGDPFQHLLVQAPHQSTPPRIVLVAETSSAMTSSDRLLQRAAINRVFQDLPAGSTVTLVAADWDTSVIVDSAPRAAWTGALAKLDGVVSAGAMHLERALLNAARHASAPETAVLFVGRGTDAFGGDALRAPLGELQARNARLSVITVDDGPVALADAAIMTGGEVLIAKSLKDGLPALIAAMTPRPLPSSPSGARLIDTWRPLETTTGDTVWVGRALEASGSGKADVAGAPPTQTTGDITDLLALWDRSRLGGREVRGVAAADRTPARALTPRRALLVLESDQDYARYGLPAPEPSDAPSPTQFGSGVGIDTSPPSVFGSNSAPGNDAQGILGSLLPGNQIGQAYGVGGLGIVGTGSGGGGTSEGTIGSPGLLTPMGKGPGRGYSVGPVGQRQAPGMELRSGPAQVRGSLDREIIDRVIRKHLNHVRYCHGLESRGRPGLRGRVVVQFTVGRSGQVLASVLQGSTVGNARFENCIVQAIRRWEFPEPAGGGIVVVSYPFVFVDSAATTPAAQRRLEPEPDARAGLRILAGEGDIGDRVRRISSALGLAGTSDPEVVAWMIDRREMGVGTITLVARLLEAAGRKRDAVRVLSEGANSAPGAVVRELRRMGADDDAATVRTLDRRRR